MKFRPGMLAPLIALVILAISFQVTRGALRTSGAWRTASRTPRIAVEDPYARIDRILARPTFGTVAVANRNPFLFGAAPAAQVVHRPTGPRVPPKPREPERPLLTAILWDADPRALVRYDGRDYTVRESSLFAEFRVLSITQTQVTLDRNGSPIVLSLRPRGE